VSYVNVKSFYHPPEIRLQCVEGVERLTNHGLTLLTEKIARVEGVEHLMYQRLTEIENDVFSKLPVEQVLKCSLSEL